MDENVQICADARIVIIPLIWKRIHLRMKKESDLFLQLARRSKSASLIVGIMKKSKYEILQKTSKGILIDLFIAY